MTFGYRHILLPSSLIVLIAVGVRVVAQTAPSATQPAGAAPQADVVDGPVTYYINNCARCHGDPESSYPDAKKHARNDELKKMIRSMAVETAMVEIDDAEVERQFALHNAMFDNKPYAWIDAARKDVIAGETIPGTKIRAGDTGVKVDNHQFTIPQMDAPITATRNGETITIKR